VNITEILKTAKERGASDIHLVVGKPPMIRIHGDMHPVSEDEPRLGPDQTKDLAYSLLDDDKIRMFEMSHELDFAFGIKEIGRYRVNVHQQRGTVGVTIRSLSTEILSVEQLGLPKTLLQFTELKNGLVLVTGPTGSGKSTTLAALIDKINNEKPHHILTVEDPIEYLHKHKTSVVEQREVHSDTESFASALKYALRQDPDVILIGEMRDLETIEAALTAAETGHLVFGTLHTNSAAKTIDRIIDVFPENQQAQVRAQLSTSLRGIVAQQLIPTKGHDGRVCALEILVGTPAVGNLIREGKSHQIQSIIQTGAKFGMQTMQSSLEEFYRKGKISREEYDARKKLS